MSLDRICNKSVHVTADEQASNTAMFPTDRLFADTFKPTGSLAAIRPVAKLVWTLLLLRSSSSLSSSWLLTELHLKRMLRMTLQLETRVAWSTTHTHTHTHTRTRTHILTVTLTLTLVLTLYDPKIPEHTLLIRLTPYEPRNKAFANRWRHRLIGMSPVSGWKSS